jgi:hypothetical protein
MNYLPSAHLGDLGAALVDGQLDESTRQLSLRHLASCAFCRSEIEAQRRLKARLQGLGEPGLPSALLLRLQALPARGSEPLPEPLPEPVLLPAAVPADSGIASAGSLRRMTVMRDPRRGRRVLAGAASLLLVGAGTALAAGGGAQAAAPSQSVSTTLNTSGTSTATTVALTDPALAVMSASFAR